jgi:hypothetical protein
VTDYHPLIARAVEGLDRSTGETRRALYERARNALVARLRLNQPALLEAQITKERLALEEAIRKVEAEVARKSRNESQAEQRADSRATPPAPTPTEAGARQVEAGGAGSRRHDCHLKMVDCIPHPPSPGSNVAKQACLICGRRPADAHRLRRGCGWVTRRRRSLACVTHFPVSMSSSRNQPRSPPA